jgi:predicted Na+-dependent transporter
VREVSSKKQTLTPCLSPENTMRKRSGLSTVDKINIVCVVIGVLIGLLRGIPFSQWLFPGSPWAAVVVVLWCGGFGYLMGYFVNLIFVSRKFRDR